jgi:hypothetical protein
MIAASGSSALVLRTVNVAGPGFKSRLSPLFAAWLLPGCSRGCCGVASFLLVRREECEYQARGSGSNQADYCRIPVENRCIEAHTVKSYSISTACFAAISLSCRLR